MQVVYSNQHYKHTTHLALPGYEEAYLEIPERADAILESVASAQLGSVVSAVDFGLAPILAVHDVAFVDFLQRAYDELHQRQPEFFILLPDAYFAVRGQRHKPEELRRLANYYAIDRDCPLLAGTWEAAYWSAQVALTAADLVRRGERTAYALCRPPGHHASADQYGGYCYLNNAAIAARWLQGENTSRVAIVDIDTHHGNGTQEIFYADASVPVSYTHL